MKVSGRSLLFFLAPITKAHCCDLTTFHVHQRTRQIENVGLPLPLLLGKKSHQEVLPLGKRESCLPADTKLTLVVIAEGATWALVLTMGD